MVGENLKSTSELSDKPQPTLSSLEEKIDKILKYQKRMAHLAIFRGVISFLIFLIFVVLPIAGGIYLAKYLKEKIDFDKVYDQYTEITDTLGDIKDAKDKVTNTTDTVKNMINGEN